MSLYLSYQHAIYTYNKTCNPPHKNHLAGTSPGLCTYQLRRIFTDHLLDHCHDFMCKYTYTCTYIYTHTSPTATRCMYEYIYTIRNDMLLLHTRIHVYMFGSPTGAGFVCIFRGHIYSNVHMHRHAQALLAPTLLDAALDMIAPNHEPDHSTCGDIYTYSYPDMASRVLWRAFRGIAYETPGRTIVKY